MPNPLTGDFEAVLQVSGGTINRLLATMHQNAFVNPKLPSFPHSVRLRIGDDHAFEGVRGLVHAQVAVPRVELIHGATDRFLLEIGVRAWFQADPGTEPMPAFIHGTLFAEYRVHDINPSCPGWPKDAAEFLWIRVVRDSVRFEGTAEDDKSMLDLVVGIGSPDPTAAAAANVAKVTRQAARLLARRFEATPHPVSKRFRHGALRSLNTPIGGSAVASPIGLSGEPVGNINSVDNLLLEGSDLAIGVDLDYIMSLTQPMLENVKKFSLSVPVHKDLPLKDFDTVYHVGLHPPTVEWEPHNSYALFKVKVNGWAKTKSIGADATFEITQNIMLDFDAGSGRLQLTPWTPGVSVHASGLYSGTVAGIVKNELLKAVPKMMQTACNNAQPSLDAMTTRTQDLSQQLKTLDAQASVVIEQGLFLRDGIILRGSIELSPRNAILVSTAKTYAEDGHSALDSWIPGGRIDRLDWSWAWFGEGEPGSATYSDRFVLRRPWGKVGRWGVSIGQKTPLPGLDGWGMVCLKITGVRVDSVSGKFVAVTSTRRCRRFGYKIMDQIAKADRLFLRDIPELSRDAPFPQLKDLPLVAARRGLDAAGATNTLLLYVDEQWAGETADALAAGLEACRRYDAGLAVLILFREGLLERGGVDLIEDIGKLGRKMGIATHVNEDVNGGWSKALDLGVGSGETGWAIISPEGIAVWSHLGRLHAHDLAAALDTHLRRCPDYRPVAHYPGIKTGAMISAAALHPGFAELADMFENPCPPIPLGRLGVSETVVTFVQKHSAASVLHLRKLASQYGKMEGEQTFVILAVLDGASQREAESFKNEFGLDVAAVADPEGKITDRFGVDVWPTTIKLDRAGIVSEVEIGMAARRDRECLRWENDDQQSDAAV
jgi:hypothetical protein